MDPEMDTEMKEYFLDMVLSESDRMTRIVSDLLVLSRLDNKKTKWSIETFDLTQSVRRLIEVMRPNLEEHSHTISFGVEKTLPEITADRGRIEQVIINIISNAIKYTSDGGQIDVKLTANESSKRVKVIVSDNGIGIPEEDVAHLFERFYRVEKSRNQDAGGTGLGLAIAKELVEAHGGSIYVKSTLGVGTVVTVELPVECKLKSE
jgi:two-component system sensor histidine kinase VicK